MTAQEIAAAGHPIALVGRAAELTALRSRTVGGLPTLVVAPAGRGKSALLAAVTDCWAARRLPVVMLTAGPEDRKVPYGALAGLFTEPVDLLGPQRAAAEWIRREAGGPEPELAAVRMAALSCVTVLSQRGRVLITADDVQWWDPASADVLAFLARRGGDRVSVVAACRTEGPSAGVLLGREAMELALPALTAAQTAEVAVGFGVPHRSAGRLHGAAGGNPRLVMDFVRGWSGSDETTPPAVARTIRGWLADLPEPAWRSLLVAALAVDPAVATVCRAAGPTAVDGLGVAERAGLVALDAQGMVAFPARAVRETLVEDASVRTLRATHALLAVACANPADRLWHAASARDEPDAASAVALAAAATEARERGERGRAADLALLAAEMVPVVEPEDGVPCPAVEELVVAAAVDAAAAGRLDLARTALARLDASGADRAARARARIAVVDAVGQALAGLEALLAQALADADAAGDLALVSEVHLRMAWHAHLALGRNDRARRAAEAAVRCARLAQDPEALSSALTMLARIQQVLGMAECTGVLRRALALEAAPGAGAMVNTPRWTALRFAVFADRLDEARHHLGLLTPRAERSGRFEDLRSVLRAAVEIEARAGHGAAAGRAARRLLLMPGAETASPGPAWHAAALAELAGGTLEQALRYAELGAESSAQEQDQIFLIRSLHVSGQVRLLLRDVAGAEADLRRVAELEERQGLKDPATVRYHADLAETLVASGEPDAAAALVAHTREAAVRLDRRGVLATLDRAEGVRWTAAGEFARAEALFLRAERTFTDLGLPLERARVLLARSVLERRRRRAGQSRAVYQAAADVFADCGAQVWSPDLPDATAGAGPVSPSRELEDPPQNADRGARSDASTRPPAPGRASRPGKQPAHAALTPAEQRVVQLVAAGCANREVAATLFLSVKTVESVLTGVYRKLGVRSRTQLCLLLNGG